MEQVSVEVTVDIQQEIEKPIVSSVEKLENVKNKIEAMEKYHQVEILKILSGNKSKINENKSGVYVNLSFLPDTTIQQLINYIDYVNDQEESIKSMEHQKLEFENSFFVDKQHKDNLTISYNS